MSDLTWWNEAERAVHDVDTAAWDTASGRTKSSDNLLLEIFKDLRHPSDVQRAFYERSAWGWTAEMPDNVHHQLLRRLRYIHRDYADNYTEGDLHWHSMLRILFLYAVLNPGVGYVQGMNEVLYVLLEVFFGARDEPGAAMIPWESDILALGSSEKSEADAFWCFSLLIGEFRELYDFGRIDTKTCSAMPQLTAPITEPFRLHDDGMAQALRRCSQQLQLLDPQLWEFLAEHSLDPRLPYYSFRWFVSLFAMTLPLSAVVEVWDILLSESASRISKDVMNARIQMLIDFACALLLSARDDLMTAALRSAMPRRALGAIPEPPDVFHTVIQLLQPYNLPSARPVVALALRIREMRMTTDVMEDGVPRIEAAAQRQPAVTAARRTPPNIDTRIRVSSDTRSSRLQARLAATVQRSLQAPRAASWSMGDQSASHAPRVGAGQESLFAAAEPDQDKPELAQAYDAGPRQKTRESPEDSTSATMAQSRHLLRRYTDLLQESNAAATVSKASTNLAAKALAWRMGGASEKPLKTTSTPPKPARPSVEHSPDLPIPHLIDSPNDRDVYGFVARTRVGPPQCETPLPRAVRGIDESPGTSEDDSFSLSLPSVQTAARLGYAAGSSPKNRPALRRDASEPTRGLRRAAPRLRQATSDAVPCAERLGTSDSDAAIRPLAAPPVTLGTVASLHMPAKSDEPSSANAPETSWHGSAETARTETPTSLTPTAEQLPQTAAPWPASTGLVPPVRSYTDTTGEPMRAAKAAAAVLPWEVPSRTVPSDPLPPQVRRTGAMSPSTQQLDELLADLRTSEWVGQKP